jgi:hypothetical protein
VIRFGLRLTLRGGREALTRLGIIVAAVALGVGLLLVTLAGVNAVNSQNARYAWLETGAGPHAAAGLADGKAPAVDPAWWLLSEDVFRGQVVGRVDVAATGARSPVPPGIPALPGPGQFYASPALTNLLRSTPAAQLADRYPGTQIGTIGPAGLPAPNSLIVIIGRTPSQLARLPGASQVTSISTTSPSSCNGASCFAIGLNARSIDLILAVVAAGLLFPVLIFIGVATRLSAARREQRFAALRLVGATPRQVAVISTVESAVAAVIGVAAGFVLFYLFRPVLAPIPFTGEPFFVHDLSLNPADILTVAVGIPVAAAAVARLALRRVSISPLGITRRVTPAAPQAWQLIPLAAGLAELAFFVVAGRPSTTTGQIFGFTSGILLTMAGLVIAGPWLTMVSSRLMTRHANRPATLIAARRLADNPQAGFRAISGLILALFAGSVAVGVITTIDAYNGGHSTTSADRSTIFEDFTDYSTSPPSTPIRSFPGSVVAQLHRVSGVQTVTIIHANPDGATSPIPDIPGPTGASTHRTARRPKGANSSLRFFAGPGEGVVSCAQLATSPALGHCLPGAETATIVPSVIGSTNAPTVWPTTATLSPQRLQSLRVQAVAVTTDGSHAAIEQARTILELANPTRFLPTTIAEIQANNSNTKDTAGYRRLADVMVLGGLAIAGCTLAVSLVAGLNDRRRPFSLLRLSGAPLGVLRRVVTLESAAPLLIGAAASMVAGFLAAYLFLRAQLRETLQPPGAEFFVVVIAGLAASLAIIASTMPLLERITGPETARNE